jgi:hypothetical protein
MLRKIVSIFLVFAFVVFLIGCIIPVANADYFPNSTATKHDMRLRYFPDVASNLYRVCNNEGKITRFIEFKDVTYSLLEDFKDIPEDVNFAFTLTINTEFTDGEYMELIFLNENEINVYNNGVKVPVEKVGKYNIAHIYESGLITII